VLATGRRRLLVSGLLTEACVSFAVLSALAARLRSVRGRRRLRRIDRREP
jgi:hypothetical protein